MASQSQVTVRTVVTVCAVALLVVALAAFVVRASLAITVTLAASLIAVALHHGVDFLRRHRSTRGSAVGMTVTVFLAALAAVLLLVVPPAIVQVSALIKEAPSIASKVQQTHMFKAMDAQFNVLERLNAPSSDSLSQSAEPALRVLSGLVRLSAEVVSTIFLVIFMVIFGDRLIQAALREVLPTERPLYERLGAEIYRSVGGYVAGLGLIGVVNATCTTAFLAAMGVSFFLPLGIVSGLSSLVPYAGPMVSGLVITLIALATRGPWVALAVLAYGLCYGQLEGQVFGPLVFRRTVHVNPLVTFLSVLFLADIGGVIGAIIAVPAAAAGQIILREALAARRERMQPR